MNTAETASDFSKLLEALDGRVASGGAGLETGVHEGRATTALIDAFDPARLALIDPWIMDADYQNRPFAQKTTDAALEVARDQVLGAYGDREGVEIHALPSRDGLAELEDAAFDWAYLDGCKYYPELLADLERCFALLKPGGVILGAGLDWAPQLGFPVRAALHALIERLDPAPELVEQGTCFALMLPDDAVLLPKEKGPRYLVVSTMKNEAPFILEWVAHYKAIGFTDFLVYTNDCDDTTVPLLDRLTARGILRHEPNHVLRRGPHKSALKYAQDHWMVAQADWVLICDVDEFLNIQTHDTIQGYMDSLPDDTDMVTFPWQVFGSGGVVPFRDQPVTAQFTRCEAAPDQGGVKSRDIKTMFRRASEVHRFGLHRPRFRDNAISGFVWRTPDGADISEKMNTSAAARVRWPAAADAPYMNHYPIRAIESYMIKKLRGRANHVHDDLGEEYFYKWDLNHQTDTSIARFAPAMARKLDGLLEDADTARLHAEGVRQIETRIAELKEDHVYRTLYQTLCASLKRSDELPLKSEPVLKKRDIVRRKMLELLPKKGKGAEIGVWEGRFSVDILEITDPETLFLIDPWEYMPEHSNVGFGRKRNAKRMPQMYDVVSEKFKDDKRVSIHRGTSQDVLSQMGDDSLDWVYIDGNHNEPFISNDLKLALRKVKPGGVIAGDDYYWNKDEGAPIKMAVSAIVAELGDKCSFQLMGQQYLITLIP